MSTASDKTILGQSEGQTHFYWFNKSFIKELRRNFPAFPESLPGLTASRNNLQMQFPKAEKFVKHRIEKYLPLKFKNWLFETAGAGEESAFGG